MNSVPQLPREELIRKKKLSDSEYKAMLQSEQKSVGLLWDILCKFTNPGNLVPDAGCETIAPGFACLLWRQHFRYLGYEKDRNCVAEALLSLANAFVGSFLTKDSYLKPPENGLSVANTLVEAWDGIAAKGQASAWAVSKNDGHVQTFSEHVTHPLST